MIATVSPDAPTVALSGEVLSRTGGGTTGPAGSIVKVSADDRPPPGNGLNTRTPAEPALAMSADVIAASSSVVET